MEDPNDSESAEPLCFKCFDLKYWPGDRNKRDVMRWATYSNNDAEKSFTVYPFIGSLIAAQKTCSRCRMVLEAVELIEGCLENLDIYEIKCYDNAPVVIGYGAEDDYRDLRYAEVFTSGTKDTIHPSSIGPSTIFSPLTTPEMAAVKAKVWLKACLESHEICGGGERPPLLPTRVIKVAPEDGVPVLCHSNGARAEYIALSYCWGKGQTAVTTATNLSQRLTGIPWIEIPLTLRDAILFTYHLGIDYLWIDALCILQDQLADWIQEASKMASVYRNAVLTLSATSSPDVSAGIFNPVPTPSHPLRTFPNVYARRSFYETHHEVFFDHYSNSADRENASTYRWPALARGWIFQERTLSTRVLHASVDELLWECRAAHNCQCSAQYVDANVRFGSNQLSFKKMGQVQKDDEDMNELWLGVVEEYTRRLFTKDSDRLIGFSGVAKRFQETGKLGGYVAGIWRKFLPLSMTWIALHEEMPAVGREARRAGEPSWSWTSVNRPVRFRKNKSTKIAEVLHRLVVLEAEATLLGVDDTGPVSGARIVASCLAVPGRVSLAQGRGRLSVLVGGKHLIFVPDVYQWPSKSEEWRRMPEEEKLREGQEVLCAEVYHTKSPDVDLIGPSYWLVLRWPESRSGYRRVGLLVLTIWPVLPTEPMVVTRQRCCMRKQKCGRLLSCEEFDVQLQPSLLDSP